MNRLSTLSDSLLIEAYKEAIHLALNQDFIRLLEEELERRRLQYK